jgi:acetate---CoA ligase (ADP-forming)
MNDREWSIASPGWLRFGNGADDRHHQETHHMSLAALLHPASVAIVGASQNPQKVGGTPVRLLRELGFAGAIYPVNPGVPQVQGLPAYAALADVPGPVDLVVIALPAEAVEAALEDAARAGAGAAIVLSSGFAEVGGEGVAAQERLAAIARRAGLTLLGPNCLGAMNIRSRLFATFSPAPLAGLPQPGGVAIVSQSGAFGAYAYSLARAGGLGLSHWVTTGNEASTSVADVLDGLADDVDTRVILAYIEGARDGLALQRALAKARAAGKPVVLTKVGRTEAGARAALSHTASLSGEDAVYQAVFDDTGAIRADTVEQMFRLGQAFSVGVMPRGRRLCILTISGGVGTLMADAASDAGVEMPPLPEAIAAELRRRIPFCSTSNPVDLTGQVTSDYSVMDYAAAEAARSDAFDGMVIFMAAAAAAPGYAPKILHTVRLVREAAPELSLGFSGIVSREFKRELEALGCLVYEEPTHAIESFAMMATWNAARAALDPPRAALAQSAPGLMNEVDGLAFLAANGVPAAPHRHVRDADAAVAAWRELGGQAVLKIVSRDLLHKSDVGGVQVGLRTEEEVRAACRAIEDSVAAHAPQARREGLLVARRLSPRAEIMLGARDDPGFGPLVVVGLGGVAVELEARTLVLTAPTTAERVRDRLERLGVLKRLGAWRGQPAIDPAELVETVVRFAALAAALGPRLATLEINPLMVTMDGVAAADAVVEIAPA